MATYTYSVDRITRYNSDLCGSGIDLMDFDGSTLYSDYLVAGTQVLRANSAPDIAQLRDTIYLPAFDGVATAEQVFFTVHILHDFRRGQQPTFHVHWAHNQGSPTGDIKWNLDYTYSHGYGAGTFPTVTTLSTVQAAGAQYAHLITPDDDMTVTADMEPDGQLLCRLYRTPADAADTFAADAFLVGVDMHYLIGQYATYERNRPFKSAGFDD